MQCNAVLSEIFPAWRELPDSYVKTGDRTSLALGLLWSEPHKKHILQRTGSRDVDVSIILTQLLQLPRLT